MSYLVSLCIPTNGVIELVFPVLDSIYAQGVDESLFEVVVCDNGDNAVFRQMISEYAGKHDNLRYGRTDAPVFLSEPETYKMATGKFIKFINHRTKLMPGTLRYLLDFVKKHEAEDKPPIVYFSNGSLKQDRQIVYFDNFSNFVCGLKILGTWSTGMAIWKQDFDKIPRDEQYNELFPHTTILFKERDRKYIIDNTFLLDEIPVGHGKKGKYDVFHAFAIEWPFILGELLRTKDISTETFLQLKKETLKFCIGMAIEFIVLRRPCSYDTSTFMKSMRVFYSPAEILWSFMRCTMRKVMGKMAKLVKIK
ncbi:hypothetical protein SAMN02910356_02050 [Selenomonas sp. GACV-9]|uniref:glycosyltransferase family A protein n=1 Tax=Selenomonas sp. GACV-9 TaxID=3158782 RepID=UPI0008E63286|nr:hypothetical protein SAMN02910356_02050 [Selenomonas ruminantium]